MRLNNNPGMFTGPLQRKWDEQAVHAELLARVDDTGSHWTEQALCAQADPDTWFPEEGRNTTKEAIAICERCPVREQCLEFALDSALEHGIFGGTTGPQRKQMRKGRRPKPTERDEWAAKIRELTRQGYTDGEVAVQMRLSERTITRIRAHYNIPPHPFNARRGGVA